MNVNNIPSLNSRIKERYENTGLGDPVGLNKIDSGHNRIVYRIIDDTYGSEIKDMVLKVQYPHSTENREEVDSWNKYKNTKFSKYLVPIVDYDDNYKWLIMPYGESVPEDLVDSQLYNLLADKNGTDISEDDFVYQKGNYANQKCCDYATLR